MQDNPQYLLSLSEPQRFVPTRGKLLNGLWQKIKEQQDQHTQRWKKKESIRKNTSSDVEEIEAFRQFIQNNAIVKMYLQKGLDSIPQIVEEFHEDDKPHIIEKRPGVCHGYSWQQLLDVLAQIVKTPPRYENADVIGVPFYSRLVDLQNTDHGKIFFSIPEVNHHLKRIFDAYGRMLDSEASLKHLNSEEGGWLSPPALKKVNYDDFICDPTAPHYGFKSWHDWFLREIKEEARPMNEDQNEIVNNSQSFSYPDTPYFNVQWSDKFWLKDYKYSLADMFDVNNLPTEEHDYYKEHFVGGTVYQGFLNPWCYHRWRAPVSGVIEKCYSTGNTYFITNPSLSRNLAHPYIHSQPLLSMMSARQIYVIKADNPKIGRICIMEIGMTEISGIHNFMKLGQRIEKGQLLGQFRFGGSSHTIIFSNKAQNLRFNESIFKRHLDQKTKNYESALQKVRSPLAWVG